MAQKIIMYPGDKIRFLTDILRKQIDLRNQIESRANVAIGFSTAVLAFALSQSLQGRGDTGILVISATSILAILCGLLALKPPRLFSKKGQEQSVFYHTAIAEADAQRYSQKLKEVTLDEQKVIEQYAREIHNLTKYSIRLKKLFTNLSIQLLVFGLIVGVLITILP